jgi:transcriptional regulator NrdR family protein
MTCEHPRSLVVCTRREARGPGTIGRSRKCLDCGVTFTTTERRDADYGYIARDVAALRQELQRVNAELTRASRQLDAVRQAIGG